MGKAFDLPTYNTSESSSSTSERQLPETVYPFIRNYFVSRAAINAHIWMKEQLKELVAVLPVMKYVIYFLFLKAERHISSFTRLQRNFSISF